METDNIDPTLISQSDDEDDEDDQILNEIDESSSEEDASDGNIGHHAGFVDSDESGSEYNDDDNNHEKLDDDQVEYTDAQLDVSHGDEFDKLVSALKKSDNDKTGNAAAHQWEKSIEEEMMEFQDELRGASGVGRRKGGGQKKREPILSPEVRDLIGQANMHYVLEEYDEAITKIEEVIRLEPKARAAWHLFSSIKTDKGEHSESLKLRIIAAHLPPYEASTWKELAIESRHFNAPQQAIYCYSQVLRLDRLDFDSIWDRAFLYKQVGMFKNAANGFKTLLKSFPHDPSVLKELCPLLLHLGEYRDAKKVLSQGWDYYRETFPLPTPEQTKEMMNVEHFRWLVNIHIYLRNWDEVIQLSKECTRWLQGRLNETFWDLLEDDREYDMERNLRSTENRIEVGLGVNTIDPELRLALGQARLEKGHKDEANYHFEQILTLDVERYVALYGDIADSYIRHDMYNEALRVLEIMERNEATAVIPVYKNIGICYRALDNYETAERFFEHVCHHEPNNMEVTTMLAEIYELVGKRELALATINKVLTNRNVRQPTGPTSRDKPLLINAIPSLINEFTRTPQKKTSDLEKERMKEARIQLEYQREKEMASTYRKLKENDIALSNGNRIQQKQWLKYASDLLEMYRTTPQLFPKNKNQKFKGMLGPISKKGKEGDLDGNARSMASRLERALVDESERDGNFDKDEVDHFRNIHFDDWIDIALKYSLLLTRHGDYDEADETLKHMSLSSPLNTTERLNALRLGRLSCAVEMNQPQIIVEVVRQYLFDEQFGVSGLRMLNVFLGRSEEGVKGFTDVNLQKFLHREIQLLATVSKDKGYKLSNKKDRVAPTKPEDDEHREADRVKQHYKENDIHLPTEQSPHLLAIYGQMMLASRSAQSGIYYLLKAYELEPNDYMICLSLSTAYLYRAFQRQADNRQHLVGQASGFLNKYRQLRGECQEVEYNYGRFFHQLGLLSIAVKHYEKVLDLAKQNGDEGVAKSAAYNLWLIFLITDSKGPMKELSNLDFNIFDKSIDSS